MVVHNLWLIGVFGVEELSSERGAGNALNICRFNFLPLSGNKRSIREQIGENADYALSGSQLNAKRLVQLSTFIWTAMSL